MARPSMTLHTEPPGPQFTRAQSFASSNRGTHTASPSMTSHLVPLTHSVTAQGFIIIAPRKCIIEILIELTMYMHAYLAIHVYNLPFTLWSTKLAAIKRSRTAFVVDIA